MEQIKTLAISLITDPAAPMRSDIDYDKVRELSESIKAHGLINPITVRAVGEKYEVVAGHRRFKACQLLGLAEVAAFVRTLDEAEVAAIMAAENLERQDIDPVDEAMFVGRLLNLPGADIVSVAKRLNRSQQWVEDRLDILDYPDYLIGALKDGQIKLGVAKWLGRITEDTYRKMYVDSAVKNGMSVLQAEYAYNQFKVGAMPSVDTIMPPPSEIMTNDRPKARAVCARCNGVAIEPNLRSVWIHIDCPLDDVSAPADTPRTVSDSATPPTENDTTPSR